jgi:DNA polymerase I
LARLFLIDGMSQIYRAYFAIRNLSNDQGVATNAVFGFANMLRKILEEEKPEYLAVAFDLGGATIRHEEFKEYKATRPRMPEDLVEQLPLIRELCAAFSIPVISLPRYEADDVISTMTRKALEKDLEVVIVSVDKDLYQLISPRVTLLDTRAMAMSVVDIEGVKKKWGVEPGQIVDLLSLIGDSSDNIPGAPGIGEKGAKTLISEYGSLDNLLDNCQEIKRKSYRESLQNNRELILRSRELIKLYSELPLEIDFEELALSPPNNEKIRELFTAWGFTRMVKDYLPPPETSQEISIYRIRKEGDLAKLSKRLNKKVVGFSSWIDEAGELQGIAIGISSREAWFIGRAVLNDYLESVAEVFSSLSGIAVHDFKPFLMAGRKAGFSFQDLDISDTMMMAYLVNAEGRDFSLGQVSMFYLNHRIDSQGQQYSLIPDVGEDTLCEEAVVVLRLKEILSPLIDKKGMTGLLRDIELPLVPVLAEMEQKGVGVDARLLAEMSSEIGLEADRISRRIYFLAGEEFNLNSPKQLSSVLFEKLELPAPKKMGKAGYRSTGVGVLESLSGEHEIARLILDYRELSKLKSTYLDALPKLINSRTGRIHTSYNQMVTSTGRLSSSNPNLQNIPIRSELGRRVRKAFIPAPGFKILAADYSQIELRIMAHLSRDAVLVEAFKLGQDIHQRTADEVFGTDSGIDSRELRRRAKVINFGVIYGQSAFTLAKSLDITRAEAQQFINEYFERYSGVREWTESVLVEAREKGFVSTVFGRIRPIPDINSKNHNLREFAGRTAVNAPIQGTAADLIKMAMITINRKIKEKQMKSNLIIQVHDELVFEVLDAEVESLSSLVKSEMENVVELGVPLKVSMAVGESWYDAK